MLRKGLSLHGQWHWGLSGAPLMMQLIAANRQKLERLITHTFPMRSVAEAWDLQMTGRCGKIVLQPWE